MNLSKLSKSIIDEKNERIKLTHSIFIKYSNNEINSMRINQFLNFAKDCVNTENIQDVRNFEILYYKYGGSGSINFDQFCCLIVEISCLVYPELADVDQDKAVSLFYKNFIVQMHSRLNQLLLDHLDDKNQTVKLSNHNKNNHTSLNINVENYFIILKKIIKKEKSQFKQILNLHSFLLKSIYKSCFLGKNNMNSNQQNNIIIQQIFIKLLKKFLICPSGISQSEVNSILNLIFSFDIVDETIIQELLTFKVVEKEEFNNINNLSTLRNINLSNSIYNSQEYNNNSHYTSRSFSKRKNKFSNNFSHRTNSQFKDSELLNNCDTLTFEKFILSLIFCLLLDDLKLNLNSNQQENFNENYKPKDYFKRTYNLKYINNCNDQEVFYAERFHNKFKLFYCINNALEGIINGVNNATFIKNKKEIEKFERFEGDLLINNDINDSLVEKEFLNKSYIGSFKENESKNKVDQISVLNQINFEKNYKNNLVKIFIFYSNKNCDDYPFFFMNIQDLISFLKDCKLMDKKLEQSYKNNDYYIDKNSTKNNNFKSNNNLTDKNQVQYKIDYNKLNNMFSKLCRQKLKNNNSYDYYNNNHSKYNEYNKYNNKGRDEREFIKRLDFKGFVAINYQIANYFKMDFSFYYSMYLNKVYCEISHLNFVDQLKSNNIDLSQEGSSISEKLISSISKVNMNNEELKKKQFSDSLNFNYCTEDIIKECERKDNNILNRDENSLTYRVSSNIQNNQNYNHYNQNNNLQILNNRINNSKNKINMSDILNINSIYSEDNENIKNENIDSFRDDNVKNVKSSLNKFNPIKSITIKVNPKINEYNNEFKGNINEYLNDDFNKKLSSYRSNLSINSNFLDKSLLSDLNKTGFKHCLKKEEEPLEQVEKSFRLKSKIKNYINSSLSEKEKDEKMEKLSNSKYSLNKYSLVLNHFSNTNDHLINSDNQRYVIEFVNSTPLIKEFIINVKMYLIKIIETFVNKNRYVKYHEYLSFYLMTDLNTIITRKDLLFGFIKFVNGFEIIVSNCQTNLFEINFNSFFDLLIYHSMNDNNKDSELKSKTKNYRKENFTIFSKILMFFDIIINSNGLKRFCIDNKHLDLYRKLVIILLKYKKYEELNDIDYDKGNE